MEDITASFPRTFKQVYTENLIETENWSVTNAEGLDFFESIRISSDFDYIKRALLYIKHEYSDTLDRSGGTKKSKAKSIATREAANEFFKKKKWLQALKWYSKSIALAENKSTELGFAYANRSALLLHRGFYKECLEDIDRALQLDYPQDKKPQLMTRKDKANQLLPSQTKEISLDVVPVLPSTNSVLRGASDAVKLSENDHYGRFVEATKDIRPGEIIAIEDPFVILVEQDHKTTHCGDCGKVCFNPIPCGTCSVEMYCSDKCRKDAYDIYHQYECIVMNFYPHKIFDGVNKPLEDRDISEIKKEQIRQLSLRVTLKGFRGYQSSCLEMTEDLYDEVRKLQTHKQKLNKTALMVLAVNCAKQFYTLKRHTNFLSKLQFKDKEDILKYHLLRNRLICCFNLGTLQFRLDNRIDEKSTSVALGLYTTYSMFNHACVENVGYGYYGKTMVVRAIRAIKKGEQCFINYGFPKDDQKRKAWMKIVHRADWEPTANSFLCSEHFSENCFDRTSRLKVRLLLTAVPTIQVDRLKNISSDSQNESRNFNKTGDDKWVTLVNSSFIKLSEDKDDDKSGQKRQLKMPYREIAGRNKFTGFFFIRDLLNFQKPNFLSNAFVADDIPMQRVVVCARITSVQLKSDYYRLVIDDGTSAILCMVKKVSTESDLQDKEKIDSGTATPLMDNSNTSWLLKRMELHRLKLIREMSTDYDQSSLGSPMMIVGNLQEFQGKNFIFANVVRRVTEEYFVNFLNYIVQSYENKVNYMFE